MPYRIFKHKKTLTKFIFIIFISCAKNEIEIPEISCTEPKLKANQTIQNLKNTINSSLKQYLFDDVLEAYVVSSDEKGNFFKTIFLQTLSTEDAFNQGIAVYVDATNLYIDYKLGSKVYLKLKDHYLDIYSGGMRFGSIYVDGNNTGGIGKIEQSNYKNVLIPSCTIVDETLLVKKGSMDKLLNDNYLNTLIELTDVQFEKNAIGKHYYEENKNIGGATNWNLQDQQGNQVIFRTSSYASFSDSEISENRGSVRGVLTKFGSDYQLISRSYEDILLTEPRVEPIFSENFQTVANNVKLNLDGWSNLVEKATKYWLGIIYSGNGFAEFNTTGTKAVSNIAWLITPKIDLDGYKNPVLTFRTAQHHLNVDSDLNTLQVYVSTNFDGVDATRANWVKLDPNLPKKSTPTYQFVSSGSIDLSMFKGKINIGFKYIGSGKDSNLSGAFQIDDIKVFAQK